MSRYTPYVFFIFAIALFIYPILDTDFWWHMRVGEYIITTKSIPYIDWLSFSMSGYAYVFHSWLTEVFLYLSHTLAGMWGVSIFYAVLLAIGLFVSAVTSNVPRSKSLLIVLFFAPFVAAGVGIRAQITTYVLAAILFYLLTKAPHITKVDKGFFRWLLSNNLFIIPLMFVLWSNLHGGFVLGLVLLGIYLASVGFMEYRVNRISQRLVTFTVYSTLLLLLCAICTGFNPYGFGQLTQAVAMQTNSTALTSNSDWYGLFRYKRGIDGYYRDILVVALGIFGLLSARYSSDATKVRLLIGALFLLCFITMRFGLLLLVVATPVLITGIYNGLYALRKNVFVYWITLGCAGLILGGSFLYHFSEAFCANANEQCYMAITSKSIKLPYEAVVYMQEYGVPYRLLNNYNHGGYLHYYFPNHQFFIDGRMDNFFIDGKSFVEEYFQLIYAREGWEEKLAQYRFDGYLGRKEWPLTQELLKGEWSLVNEDEVNVLLLPPVE